LKVMSKRIAIIHTLSGNVPTFKKLTDELLPGVDIFNMVDESLLQNTVRAGHLQPQTARHLVSLIGLAEEAGADAVLVTCSSVGPAVEASRALVNVPVLRVDEPMANQAVEIASAVGKRIGVAATLSTTLAPTTALVRARAEAAGRYDLTIISQLCEGAFEAVVQGDTAKHDAIVTAGLEKLAGQVDVIVLAQASMARVVEALPDSSPAQRVPILSSPRSGVEAMASVLGLAPVAL
jgi:Asp/Glu/hydantoin racemase